MNLLNKKEPCGCQEREKAMLAELDEKYHGHLAEICGNLKMLIGINQRLLQRIEESSSIPKGHALTVSQSSPAQNTLYTMTSDMDGIAQGFLLCGPGNLSLYSESELDLAGQALITTIPSNGNPVFVPFWHPTKVGLKFAVSTDSATPSMLSLTTWLEPIGLTPDQLFMLRR